MLSSWRFFIFILLFREIIYNFTQPRQVRAFPGFSQLLRTRDHPLPNCLRVTQSDSEECEIHGCMYGDGVADAVGAVSNELRRRGGALAVDGHGVPALRRVGGVLGCRESEDVRPLLHRLGVCVQG
jgi:hypothetical protein